MLFLRSILSMFAAPLGAAINNALAVGSAGVIAWSVSKGADAGMVTPIVAGVVNVISLAIAAGAASQGIQIPIINADTSNGARVVSASDAKAKGLPPIDGPKK